MAALCGHSLMDKSPTDNIRTQSQLVLKACGELSLQRSLLVGGKVVDACLDLRDAIAALTKTLVDLDFIVTDIEARARLDGPTLAALAGTKRKEPDQPGEPEPAKTVCIR